MAVVVPVLVAGAMAGSGGCVFIALGTLLIGIGEWFNVPADQVLDGDDEPRRYMDVDGHVLLGVGAVARIVGLVALLR